LIFLEVPFFLQISLTFHWVFFLFLPSFSDFKSTVLFCVFILPRFFFAEHWEYINLFFTATLFRKAV
jgi:hypothetical protein